MANLITLGRLILVLIIIALLEYASPDWQCLNIPLIIIAMLLDGLDGIVARKLHENSLFGALFDIATDRIIEIILWVALTKIGLVSIWIPIVFIIRGVLVDDLRKKYVLEGQAPFEVMRSRWGNFLVASRSMRFIYGSLKLFTFTWLLFLVPARVLWLDLYTRYFNTASLLTNALIYTTLACCLVRGAPIMLEEIFFKKKHEWWLSRRN